MRVARLRVFASVAFLAALGLIANIPTTTRVAVDYRVIDNRQPLYQKVIAFAHRDLEMRSLAAQIVGDAADPEAKALRILAWTHDHVLPQPERYPVFDDHPYHVVVRGYGANDQAADVFANLAAYAGMRARLVFSRDAGGGALYAFALAEIGGSWRVFDVRESRAFRDRTGNLATVEELRDDPSLTASLPAPREANGIPYAVLFASLNLSEHRSVDDQMPIPRLLNEVRRVLGLR